MASLDGRKYDSAFGRELSPEAMAALREFYAERDRQQTQFVELKAQTTDKGHTDGGRPGTISMEAFTEDWNASQFWVGLTPDHEIESWMSQATDAQPL